MQTYALGVPVFHPVIEFLVVAVIKTLLLRFPLEVPVCLGDEPELPVPAFDRRDHRRPVVVDRLYSCTRPPGTLEDMVQHEHSHVAPDTVTLIGDLRYRLDYRLPELRPKGVELKHIRPRRKVGIAAAGNTFPAASTKDAGSFLASPALP